jgi:hypothetical protein
MSRRSIMSDAARTRARRQALRRELARVAEIVRRKTAEALAVLDEPTMGAEQAVILEGRIIGDTIVNEAEAERNKHD